MKIYTTKGIYKYKFIPLCAEKKKINKEIAKENLLLFKKIAERNNLQFSLAFGTMLGAIREHDFIDHDDDIDLWILSEQKTVFFDMLFELREYGFELARFHRRGLASILRKGENIDIYILHPMKEGLRGYYNNPMPEKYLTDLSLYEFQGDLFPGSADSEESMVFFYGEDWKTPIPYINYEMPFYKQWISLIKEYIIAYIPDWIFFPITDMRKKRKRDIYAKRLIRLNNFLQKK
ncbi:MAG: LicD family protein [Dysgonomonas sp.]|uniref:LicD family protein n=1 Tax=Dysgonomonas sp. TaxID=1891233 RepID=UPI003A85BE96